MSADKVPVPLLLIAVLAAVLLGTLLPMTAAPPASAHLTRTKLQELPEPTPIPEALAPVLNDGWLLMDPDAAHVHGSAVDIDPEDPLTLSANPAPTVTQLDVTASGPLLFIVGPYGVLRTDKGCQMIAADRLPNGLATLNDVRGCTIPFTFEGHASAAEATSRIKLDAVKDNSGDVIHVQVTSLTGADLQHGFIKMDKAWVANRITLQSFDQPASLFHLGLQRKP